MRVLLVFAALVAYASAKITECGPLQRLKVKNQWGNVFANGNIREAFARELWTEFFFEDPEARGMFERVRGDNVWSPEFQAHGLRVLGGLDMSISLLAEEDVFEAQLAHLKSQHDGRNVSDENWDTFKNALTVVLARHDTTGHFDVDAWRACGRLIVAGIRGE